MDHSVLTILDLGIIAAYLVIMVLVGVYSVRRIQNTMDYYVAGRSFGPMVLMATVCATIIGGSGLMGRAGVAYTDGFKAVLTAIPYLLGMFIFSGIAGKISDIGMQYGITSIPELFERRFGRAAKITLSVLIAFAMMGTVASQVTATATIIRMLGGEFGLSYEMGALIATVVFMVYTATSGLFGVVYTDVLQFYMLIVFVYILIPVAALFNVGGFANFAANLDQALVEPHIDGSILGDIITDLVFTMAGAEMWQRAFAAKSRRAAKRGMFLGTAVYGVTIVLVYFMGVVGRQILGGDILAQYGSTDAVVPALAIRILPAGLTGLALAGMLSVIMSTADSYLLSSATNLTNDIYVKYIRKDATDKQKMLVLRGTIIVFSFIAVALTLYFPTVLSLQMTAYTMYGAAITPAILFALFSKKVTPAGGMAGILVGGLVTIIWTLMGTPYGIQCAIVAVPASVIAILIVSAVTRCNDPKRSLEALYQDN